MNIRATCAQAAKALVALPDENQHWLTPQDREDIAATRLRLWLLLFRNGYELVSPGSVRIQAVKMGAIIGYQLRDKNNVPPHDMHSGTVYSITACNAYNEKNGTSYGLYAVRYGDLPYHYKNGCLNPR